MEIGRVSASTPVDPNHSFRTDFSELSVVTLDAGQSVTFAVRSISFGAGVPAGAVANLWLGTFNVLFGSQGWTDEDGIPAHGVDIKVTAGTTFSVGDFANVPLFAFEFSEPPPVQQVPEPDSLALFLVAAIALVTLRNVLPRPQRWR